MQDKESKRNAIVVGGEGLLGKKLVQGLVEDGSYIVHSLDLHIPPEGRQVQGVASYIQTDITNEIDVLRALKEMDSVFLTASLQPCVKISDDQMCRVNIDGARNIVNACKAQGARRLIYTSSTSVTMGKYLDNENGITSESTPYPKVPLNAYVESKGKAELLVRKADGCNQLNTISLRLAGLLGGKNSPVVEFFTKSFLVYGGDGNFKIDFVHIESVVKAQILAEKKLFNDQTKQKHNSNGVSNGASENGHIRSTIPISGKVYMITMRDKCTIKELMEYVSQLRGVPRPVGIPHWFLLPIASLIRWFFLATGVVLAPMSKMHIEFMRPFNCLPDLANKELGWEDERSWKDIIKKAISEY